MQDDTKKKDKHKKRDDPKRAEEKSKNLQKTRELGEAPKKKKNKLAAVGSSRTRAGQKTKMREGGTSTLGKKNRQPQGGKIGGRLTSSKKIIRGRKNNYKKWKSSL